MLSDTVQPLTEVSFTPISVLAVVTRILYGKSTNTTSLAVDINNSSAAAAIDDGRGFISPDQAEPLVDRDVFRIRPRSPTLTVPPFGRVSIPFWMVLTAQAWG